MWMFFSRGVHMVVATPGRLMDLLDKKILTLDICRYVLHSHKIGFKWTRHLKVWTTAYLTKSNAFFMCLRLLSTFANANFQKPFPRCVTYFVGKILGFFNKKMTQMCITQKQSHKSKFAHTILVMVSLLMFRKTFQEIWSKTFFRFTF